MATNKLLFDESPLVIQPTLAKAIGLNEAIILQQIHYWLKKSKDGWVYNTYDEWKEQFPFFSEATIKRTITKLKKSGVLIVSQNKKSTWDRVNHYKIDYETMNSLIESDCTHRTGQNDLIDNSKMTSSSYSTETTTETTTTNGTKVANQSSKNNNLPANTTLVFNAYCEGMKQRYGENVTPQRNAAINSQLKKMVERIGLDNSVLVARNYPLHQNSWYVQKTHSVGLMLADCESLLIQVQSGQMVTRTGAYQADKTGHYQAQIIQDNQRYDDKEEF